VHPAVSGSRASEQMSRVAWVFQAKMHWLEMARTMDPSRLKTSLTNSDFDRAGARIESSVWVSYGLCALVHSRMYGSRNEAFMRYSAVFGLNARTTGSPVGPSSL
jgi:hypothetical protein